MSYLNVEISFRTADPDLLDGLPSLADLHSSHVPDAYCHDVAREFFWLSTCNRVELFTAHDGTAGESAGAGAVALAAATLGLDRDRVERACVVRRGPDAVTHLASLAAGLESLAVGEEQIVGQVRAAFLAARDAGTTGPLLARAFDHAMHVAKRVRAETGLGRLGMSLLQHGLAEAAHGLDGLAGRHAAVVGVGAVGTQAVRALLAAGAASVVVAGSSPASGERFAARHPGVRAFDGRELAAVAARSDLVVTASSAREPLLDRDALATAREDSAREDIARGDSARPLVLLDLARPRDVDPGCAALAGVTLHNIEQLGALLAARGVPDDVELAWAIVEQERARFTERALSASTGLLVRAMRSSANAIVEAEMTRLERRLPALGPREMAEAATALHRLVGKVLHEPLVRARSLSAPGDAVYLDALTMVFGSCPVAGGERRVG